MMEKKLAELIVSVPGAEIIGESGTVITGIEYDSRRIKPGNLFVAVCGFEKDGNEFIPRAIGSGAVAVLTEKKATISIPSIIVPSVRRAMPLVASAFYNSPGKKMTIIGVTGTNGKSSSVSLIKDILTTAGEKVGMVNSLVYDTGGDKYPAPRTTPEAVDLQRLLYEMKQNGCTYAVLEVSSHALILHRVDEIDFEVGLYTTFSRDHLDFHRSMEEYLKAKKILMERLIKDGKKVVLNIDEPEFAAFAGEIGSSAVTFSAEGRPADVMLTDAKLFPDHSEFSIVVKNESRPATIQLPGRYNLTNGLGAAAIGTVLGIDAETIILGLRGATPVPGRFQPISMGQPYSVIIDYAHTPDAIERLCNSARELTKGKLMILFGCGGDRDRGKRPLMGEAASKNSDLAVITSDNPRTEDPRAIIEDIYPGMVNKNYITIIDRAQAIKEILKRADKGDTILIAGKGAEDYQEIMGKKYPFEDKIEITGALAEQGYTKVVTE